MRFALSCLLMSKKQKQADDEIIGSDGETTL